MVWGSEQQPKKKNVCLCVALSSHSSWTGCLLRRTVTLAGSHRNSSSLIHFSCLTARTNCFFFHPGCCGNLVVPNRTGTFFRICYFTDHDSFVAAHWATRGCGARGATMYSSSWSCAFFPGALAIPPTPSWALLLRQLRAPRCARLSAPLGAAASVDT